MGSSVTRLSEEKKTGRAALMTGSGKRGKKEDSSTPTSNKQRKRGRKKSLRFGSCGRGIAKEKRKEKGKREKSRTFIPSLLEGEKGRGWSDLFFAKGTTRRKGGKEKRGRLVF